MQIMNLPSRKLSKYCQILPNNCQISPHKVLEVQMTQCNDSVLCCIERCSGNSILEARCKLPKKMLQTLLRNTHCEITKNQCYEWDSIQHVKWINTGYVCQNNTVDIDVAMLVLLVKVISRQLTSFTVLLVPSFLNFGATRMLCSKLL